MAAILDLAQNEDLPWVDSGGLFFLFLHTSIEFISGEKPLLTFLSNLSRSLLRLIYRSTCKVMQTLSDFYFPSTVAWGPTLTPIRARDSSLFLTNQCLLD